MGVRIRIKSAAELRGMNEKAFMRQILQLARMYGWHYYHTFFSKGSQPGFPDLVLVKDGVGVIFAELKSDIGVVTPAQEYWLTLLSKNNYHRAVIWRPKDWNDIVIILKEGG